MLQLTPLSKPVAIVEILILLIVVAAIGWFIAKLLLKGKISSLRASIEERKVELAACKAIITPVASANYTSIGNASKTVYPVVEPVSAKYDDFKILEGIGPKIEELLNKEGISSYATLSQTSPIRISNILRNAGPRFQIHDPTSWPEQARLANFNKWDELEELKQRLIAGKAK